MGGFRRFFWPLWLAATGVFGAGVVTTSGGGGSALMAAGAVLVGAVVVVFSGALAEQIAERRLRGLGGGADEQVLRVAQPLVAGAGLLFAAVGLLGPLRRLVAIGP